MPDAPEVLLNRIYTTVNTYETLQSYVDEVDG